MGANQGGTQEKHKKDPNCVFCKGSHKPNLCTTMTCTYALLHAARFAVMKNAGLCLNCLGCHKVFQCPSKFTCRECHKKHPTGLCHAFTIEPVPGSQPTSAATSNTDQATPPTVTTAAQTVRATTQSQDTRTIADTTLLSAISTSVCLLKTAIANVSAGQTTVEGHILIDEGAQRSFITQELADQL